MTVLERNPSSTEVIQWRPATQRYNQSSADFWPHCNQLPAEFVLGWYECLAESPEIICRVLIALAAPRPPNSTLPARYLQALQLTRQTSLPPWSFNHIFGLPHPNGLLPRGPWGGLRARRTNRTPEGVSNPYTDPRGNSFVLLVETRDFEPYVTSCRKWDFGYWSSIDLLVLDISEMGFLAENRQCIRPSIEIF
jgi:hypothetical protein